MVYVANEQTPIAESHEAVRTNGQPRGGEAAAELDRLGDEIAELAAHVHAATYQLLARLRVFDEQGGWGGGFRSCAHWLSWRTSIGMGTAREHVRVARALGELPQVSEAMSRGELSFAKVRALTRIATADNEKQLLELARQGTASHIETVVRAWRRVDRIDEQRQECERHRTRDLTLYHDDDGMVVIRGRLDPEVGALLDRALAAASEALYRRRTAACAGSRDASERSRDEGLAAATAGQRRADAIGLIAESALRLGVAAPAHAEDDQLTRRDGAHCDRALAVQQCIDGLLAIDRERYGGKAPTPDGEAEAAEKAYPNGGATEAAETPPSMDDEPDASHQRPAMRDPARSAPRSHTVAGSQTEPRTHHREAQSSASASSAQPCPGPSQRAGSKSAITVGRADRFQMVMHVDAEALRANSDAGQSVLASGTRVPAETSRRFACDASRVVMTHDADGNVLSVGRRTRTVPPAIRRALDQRDRGCRFPGCGVRYCDAHHITHWADGGATRLDNLVLLCRLHHRAVHEEGFRVQLMDSGEPAFTAPDGQPVPEVPPAPELPRDPVAALTAAHRASGIEIDAWTATPGWKGERLDLDYTLLTLRGPCG